MNIKQWPAYGRMLVVIVVGIVSGAGTGAGGSHGDLTMPPFSPYVHHPAADPEPTTRKAAGPDGDVVLSGLEFGWAGQWHSESFTPAYRDNDRKVVYTLAGVRVPRAVVPGINGFHEPPIVDPAEPGWREVEVDQPVDFIWSTQHEAAAGYFMQCSRYFFLFKGIRRFSDDEVSRMSKLGTTIVVDPTTNSVMVFEVQTSDHVKDRLRHAAEGGTTRPTMAPVR